MTRQTQNTKNMIVYLLIGCLVQYLTMPIGTKAQETTGTGTGTSSSSASSSIASNAAGTYNQLLKETGNTLAVVGKETTKAAEQAIKASGRMTLTVGYLLSQMFNGLSATAATGAGYLASGAKSVDSMLSSVPVVRVVVGGLKNVATGVSSTINEQSQTGRQLRQKLYDDLRQKLDSSETGGTANADAGASASVDASASASVA